MICGDCIASFMAFYLPWPGGLQAIVPPRGILKSLEQRADERTRTADLISLRVRIVTLWVRQQPLIYAK